MCGIVGYSGDGEAWPVLLEGIKRLEYRGYDSAGIATVSDKIHVTKEKGEIAILEQRNDPSPGCSGIAHTRWATHGKPSKENAHPFTDCKGELALVHNGIIENFSTLKDELEKRGHVLKSETDSEMVAHLLEEAYRGDPLEALRAVSARLEGSYALVMVHSSHKGIVYGCKHQSPLVVGMGAGENLLASDVTPLLKHTQNVKFLEDGEFVEIGPKSVKIVDAKGKEINRNVVKIEWRLEDAEKGGFAHFMLKEIHDVPQAIRESIRGRLQEEVGGSLEERVRSVKLIACGTSYHAGLAGKYIIEEIAKIPATAEFASEYRYTAGPVERPLVVLISQSGETADTLAAAKEAKRRGCHTVAITNVVESTLARYCDRVVYTRAGPEIGVAATKTWITQVVAIVMLALEIGQNAGTLTPKAANECKKKLKELPRAVYNILDKEEDIQLLAKKLQGARSMFFIGRHLGYPTAMEGALKMKEISYIHAEGYAAGELKHGPLALLTDETPVVAIIPGDFTRGKMISHVKEVAARDAPVLAIGEEGDSELERLADWYLLLPPVDAIFSPVTFGVALQLLSYYVANLRGCEIDKPRNLAKSVTVE